MIHLYCGDGKGKTTASVGLAVRAAGAGLKVVFSQFIKGQATGEISVLKSIPGITVMRAENSEKFTYQMSHEERRKSEEKNRLHLQDTFRVFNEIDADMLIMDEVVTASGQCIVDEKELKRYVISFDPAKELILTGSPPELWMIESADYVTDMEKIKHPFDKGVQARKGIEF